MDTENTLGADIRAAGDKARYDAACKAVISAKIILAWIIKYCVEEFKDFAIKDIVKCIEGEPKVSAVGVMPNTTNTTKIRGISNEDSSINEGTITYDIIFTVVLPSKERVRFIINVEAQNIVTPGYPLKKRIVFYGCRMISSQYGREFDHADYGKLKKVYTIWICAASPKKLQNRIIGYAIKPYVIEGDSDDGNDDHDLLRCIIIYLGEESNTKNKLLRLLEVLLSGSKNYTEKKRVLHDEYDIEMTSKFNEEVMEMCNLSDGIWNKGYNEGIEQGMERGMAQGMERGMERGMAQGMERGEAKGRLEMIKNLMRSLGLSAEKAMEALLIPQSEWGKYLPNLAN